MPFSNAANVSFGTPPIGTPQRSQQRQSSNSYYKQPMDHRTASSVPSSYQPQTPSAPDPTYSANRIYAPSPALQASGHPSGRNSASYYPPNQPEPGQTHQNSNMSIPSSRSRHTSYTDLSAGPVSHGTHKPSGGGGGGGLTNSRTGSRANQYMGPQSVPAAQQQQHMGNTPTLGKRRSFQTPELSQPQSLVPGPGPGHPRSQISGRQGSGVHLGHGLGSSAPTTTAATAPVVQGVGEEAKPIVMYVRALYDYDAEAPQELSLAEDSVVSVLATNMDGWWEGEVTDSNGQVRRGLFPSNFTEPITF